MTHIDKLIYYSYKNYKLTQLPSEIKSFCEFYNTLNCKNILEIGSLYGGTFFLLCKLSNLKGKKISIDYPFYGEQSEQMKFRKTKEKMKSFAEDVHLIEADSHDLLSLEKLKEILNGEKLDFIFIDGDHSYEGVKKDFEMYASLLKDGGYVAFHDINDTTFHRDCNCFVHELWNQLNIENKFEFNSHGCAMGIGVVQIFKHRKKLNLEIKFEGPSTLYINNLNCDDLNIVVSIRDRDTKIPIYFTELNFSKSCNSLFLIPQINYDFVNDENFSGFLLEFYDIDKNFIDSKEIIIKERKTAIDRKTRNYNIFDCLFINYKQLFYDKIYDNLDLNDVKTVIDIGANVGLFSNYISYKPNVRLIHAIEPCSTSFNELKKQFFYYNGVKCHNIGIHYFDGISKLKINKEMSILNTFINNECTHTEDVKVTTLPRFLDDVGLNTVDLIKMDIEGLEYEVLNSINDDQILRGHKYIIEYHLNDDGKAEILQNRFRKLGYTVQNFPDLIPCYVNNNIAFQGFFFANLTQTS
jgi:FkbM family methyltransferase